MSSGQTSELIEGIDSLLDIFVSLPPMKEGDAVEIEFDAVNLIQKRLRVVRHLAFLNERELGALRLNEAAKRGRVMIDELASEQQTPMIGDPDEKVIRPVFGGRKRQGGEHE